MGSTLMGPLQKQIILTDWGKKVCPVTFGDTKVGLRERPKGPSVKTMKFAVTPLVRIPFCPFVIWSLQTGATTGPEGSSLADDCLPAFFPLPCEHVPGR